MKILFCISIDKITLLGVYKAKIDFHGDEHDRFYIPKVGQGAGYPA
jgi:hypothetical protein